MPAANSSGPSRRRSQPQAPSIAPKSITKSIYRSAAWRPATSDQGRDFKTVKAEQKCSAFSFRNLTCCHERNGGEGGIRTHGTVSRTLAFEASTFNRSVTSPRPWPSVYQRACRRGYAAFNRNGRGTTKFPAAILPPRGKEGLEKGSGFFGWQAWRDFYLMIQFGTGQDFETGAEGAALRIVGCVN